MDHPIAVSYHDVLLRNGFIEELQPNEISNNRPFSIYIRKANNDEGVDAVEVEAYLSFWRLRYNGKSIKLDALVPVSYTHLDVYERQIFTQ